MFARWVAFRALDTIWGNGESLSKLCRFICVILLLILVLDASTQTVTYSIWKNIARAFQIFFGVTTPKEIPEILMTTIVFARLVTFGLFMAILIKRLNRR